MKQKSKNAESGSEVLSVVIGSVLTIIWVAASFYAVWIFYNYSLSVAEVERLAIEARSEFISDIIASLAWPFALVFLSVPLLFMFMLGGFRAIKNLSDLKKHFSDLPDNIETLENLSSSMDTLDTALENADQRFDKVKKSITSELNETIPNVISNALAGIGLSGTTHVADRDVDKVAELDRLYQEVKYMYSELLEQYEDKTGHELETSRGWLSRNHVDKFKDQDLIDDRVRTYMYRTLDVEAETRRSARSNLHSNQIEDLRALRRTALNEMKSKFDWIKDELDT